MSDHPSRAGTDVRSGIVTESDLESEPPGFRVTWIDWDSDFRRELRLNDLVIAVDGRPLDALLKPGSLYAGVGQPGERTYWEQIGAGAGSEIDLTVVRDGVEAVASGRLGTDWFHYDAEGRPAIGPGGPARLANDGFDSPWMSWLESLQRKLSIILTVGWAARSFTSRRELGELLDERPRLDVLLSRWPGAFAQTLAEDWARAVELARGRLADPPIDLEYRAVGARRIEVARAAAAAAWEAILAETADDRVPPSPAGSALEREQWVGKVVELPPLSMRDVRSDLGRTFAAAGSPRDGYWFLLVDRPEVRAFWQVFYRYQGQVNPTVSERFRFLVRVLDDVEMFTVDGGSYLGLGVEALAVLAGGDELFVDVRQPEPTFAGEPELAVVGGQEDRDDGDPAAVVAAMIDAIKLGDERGWRGLFAPWRTYAGGGRPLLDRTYGARPALYASDWERSRRLIMGAVLDARVGAVEKVRRVVSHAENPDLPDVDRVVVWVDHYGELDGEHRVFQDVTVHRRWELERLDDGPWRIVSLQSL